MINRNTVFVKIKEIITEFFSNRKIIGLVGFIIVVAVFKILLNGFVNGENDGSSLTKINKVRYEKINYDFLNSDENELVEKFIKGEIKDDVSKLKFSTIMKGPKGILTIKVFRQMVKDDRLNGSIDDLTMDYWNTIINKMENTKIEWSSTKFNDDGQSKDNISHN